MKELYFVRAWEVHCYVNEFYVLTEPKVSDDDFKSRLVNYLKENRVVYFGNVDTEQGEYHDETYVPLLVEMTSGENIDCKNDIKYDNCINIFRRGPRSESELETLVKDGFRPFIDLSN